MCKSQPTDDTQSLIGACTGHVNHWKFWGTNYITGTADPKVVKICTQVAYINSSNRMTYHQHKGCGYSHVTVLKFCRLPWCSASRGFVSDSWATCQNSGSIGFSKIRTFNADRIKMANLCRIGKLYGDLSISYWDIAVIYGFFFQNGAVRRLGFV